MQGAIYKKLNMESNTSKRVPNRGSVSLNSDYSKNTILILRKKKY
jgi:hypothetical protein